MLETTRTAEPDTDGATRLTSLGRLRALAPRASILYATVALFIISAFLAPGSVGTVSLQATLPFFGILAIVAIGQTVVVAGRGIDLSVPGMMSLAAMAASRFATDSGSELLGVGLAATLAVIVGLLNGFLVSVLRITPLVATLAMSSLLAGASFAYSKGSPARAPASIIDFASGTTLGISNACWLGLTVAVIFAVLMSRTRWGRELSAVGANESAAYISGIPIRGRRLGSYIISALCASAAGVVLAGYVQTPNSYLGADYLLPSIAAVVIGGTSLAGGRGSVVGTLVAALFLTQLDALVFALGAPDATRFLVQAVILAAAVSVPAISRIVRRRARRRRPRPHSHR